MNEWMNEWMNENQFSHILNSEFMSFLIVNIIIGWQVFNTEQWWTSKKKYLKDIIIIIKLYFQSLNKVLLFTIHFCSEKHFTTFLGFAQLYFPWNTQYEIWNNIDFSK